MQKFLVEAGHRDEQTAGAFELAVDFHFESREVFFVGRLAAPARFDEIGEAAEVKRAIDLLVGLRTPTEGTVQVLGLDPVADRSEFTARVAVQPQEASSAEWVVGRRGDWTSCAKYYQRSSRLRNVW